MRNTDGILIRKQTIIILKWMHRNNIITHWILRCTSLYDV